MRVLVTGGAGFIGSHTVDMLVEAGHSVCVLDSFDRSVHGGKKPDYLNPHAEYTKGNTTKVRDWQQAGLPKADALIHLAAQLSVEESMHNPTKYVYQNIFGTALMYKLIRKWKPPLRSIVVASSEAIYGEGPYSCKRCGRVRPQQRANAQLACGEWEPSCPTCGGKIEKAPASEEEGDLSVSVYALSKWSQERIALMFGEMLGISTVVFRYFNVYGPRQSFTNPYSGVCSLFCARAAKGQPLQVYEDGRQTRDFIFVKDLAKCNVIALEARTGSRVYNVGTGQRVTILELANHFRSLLPACSEVKVTNTYRPGDVRHGWASTNRVRNELGFKVQWPLSDGLKELADWMIPQLK